MKNKMNFSFIDSKRVGNSAILITFAGLLCSCSQLKAPESNIAKARLVVEQAQIARADQQVPDAYNLAKQKLVIAETAMKKEDYTLARRMSEQATVDAIYAKSRSENIQASLSAESERSNAKSLQQLRR